MTIVADEKIPFLKGLLEPWASVKYLDGRSIRRTDLLKADALVIRTRTRCDRALLHGTSVRFIATATIGFEHIDTEYCEHNGIHWVSAPGCNAGSVMQYIASVLATWRKVKDAATFNRSVGIIGVGAVGKKVEFLAKTLGMTVLLNDPPREREEGSAGFVPLDHLLSNCDFITLHVPLNRSGPDRTLGLIGRENLAKMKRNAVLVNTSRGEVVEEQWLKQALGLKSLQGAVLDVWTNEPHIDRELLDLATIATPHIAGYSLDGKRNATIHIVRELVSFLGIPIPSLQLPDLPLPEKTIIDLSQADHDPGRQLEQAILHSYNVMADDDRLRRAPCDFEQLRNNYPPRREFGAYEIKPPAGAGGIIQQLSGLGFRLAGKMG